MTKHITLFNLDNSEDSEDITIALSGDVMKFGNQRYRLSRFDMTRLDMWLTDLNRRYSMTVGKPLLHVPDYCCDHVRDKPGPQSDDVMPPVETNFNPKMR